MKNLILFTVLASLNSSLSFAQSDFMTQIAFYGPDAATVRSECKAVEQTVREKLQLVEKKILRSENALINVKAEVIHAVTPIGDGPDFIDDYCQLHFVSFTEALGFEKIRSHHQRRLGKKRVAQIACMALVETEMTEDENIVYARTSRSYRMFHGGHQCEVIGVRVVQMLTR